MSPDPVPVALRRWSAAQPEALAVVSRDDRLTWRELEHRSAAVAAWLRDAGVGPDVTVGLHLRKCCELVVAVHAVLRAGGAFVPVDTGAPADRVQSILRDADVAVMISDEAGWQKTSTKETHIGGLVVGGSWPGVAAWDDALVHRGRLQRVDRDQLAYVMYTSGSTGAPKGMRHSHATSLGFAEWGVRQCDLAPQDRVANFSPLHFDISVFDYFSSALAGSTLVLVPEEVLAFPASTLQLLASEQVTVLFTVPFALSRIGRSGLIGSHDLRHLRWVLFGGEPFQPSDLARLMRQLPGRRFANVYGPAEAPACVVHEVRVPPEDETPVPIGTLAANTDALVLEFGSTNEVEVGAAGELVICAPSVTLGYHNRPDLNERTSLVLGGRTWFRTGDVVTKRPDGIYEFHGRNDRMVKTRGYRVELDEVEAVLANHPAVVGAAVFSTTHDGTTLVRAAVVCALEAFDERVLFEHLRATLPTWALPVDIVRLDAFPRTTSDKIDRRALAAQAVTP